MVGLATPSVLRSSVEEYLGELALLAESAGADVIHTILQSRPRVDAAFYVGRGKAEELGWLVGEKEISSVIFDDDLTAVQVRNLGKVIPCKIIDRSALILDIFASRAKTREAKTQVELAQLQYMLPRLTRQWTHLSKQFGGIGTKGPGETQIETDRRAIRSRISHLKGKLKEIAREREVQRKGRDKLSRVALVGYTNAGKSTLMNYFSDAGVIVEDRLFATLDSTVRSVTLSPAHTIILSDTVGFISDLPTMLVAAFRATLEEVIEADLILHVRDISHEDTEAQRTDVQTILESLGIEASDRRIVEVWNKVDRLDAEARRRLDNSAARMSAQERPVAVSALTGEGIGALIEAIDLTQLARLDAESAREEIRDIVNEIIAIKNIVMSIAEQEELLDDICNDVLGYGPLEPLLARDDIADIMVNGADTVYIEVAGKIQRTGIRFRDNQQLLNICQRIVSQVGRRVDEASPICDARLADGSRVNVIAPPLAIDGPSLTIRKFKKDKLTLDQLVKFASISPEGAEILKIIGRVRCNVLVSGGTGSGKTTLLNCLTSYIDEDERIITCEDAAELQLQQPHVVRLETRPPNLEGEGQVTMRDLVKNCLRMRPERIIVGEVRGPEAFDLLQAMNTGHDGSMGTLHANSPREAMSRIESMITMGGYALPSRTIREMICTSVDVIVQAARLRDGSRRITHVTEVMGMEGDVIITQDLFIYEILGEDANGRIIGRHRSTGIGRPRFWDRARYYGEEQRLATALDAAEAATEPGRT
ncbi:MAG: GTPase HflX [Bradyrhizobiaceae bacterium]|nr:MAG: GTPase HflX [Bradyrhizobiaceae bacterium]